MTTITTDTNLRIFEDNFTLDQKVKLRNDLRYFYNNVPDSSFPGIKVNWDKVSKAVSQLTVQINKVVE